MERWEYQVVLVNKWGKALKQERRAGSETWQFDATQASDLVTLLKELGSAGCDLIGIDTNASDAEGNYSYVGSGSIF